MTATSVDEVVLHRVRLPLRRPHVAAHGREERREVVLVSVAAGGVTGWGECPALSTPGYSDETIDRAWVALRDELGPALRRTGTVAGGSGPMARGALADALLDRSVRAGEAALPGAAPPVDVVPFGSVVAVDGGVEAVVAAARDAVAAGAALLVVKIRPGWSTVPLAAVIDAADVPVAVDANGSFGVADLDELRRVGALGPVFVEQPAPAVDLTLSARFPGECATYARLYSQAAALFLSLHDLAPLRARLANRAPKVGRNDDEADKLLATLFGLFAEACEAVGDNGRGGRVRPGTGSAMYYVWLAKGHDGMREPVVGATANGRKRGDYFSANLAPAHNARAYGPTSVLQSFSRVDYHRVCNGGPITMELSDGVFRDQESIRTVALLVLSRFGDAGVTWLWRYVGRIPVVGHPKVRAAVENLVRGFGVLSMRRVLPGIILGSALVWLGYGTFNYVIMAAFRMTYLPFSAAALVLCATGFSMVLPSSPGAMGVFEWAGVQALAVYGVEQSLAFGYMLGLHLFTNLGLIAIGLLGLLVEGLSYADLRGQMALPSAASPDSTATPS